ncbi:MAG: hypothetical protein IKB28_03900 [Clostridia bacterium]|nr:hypothetical protein [Clostridia bacterium]
MSLQTIEAIHDATVWAYGLGLLVILWYAPKYGIKRFKAVTYAFVIFELVIFVNSGFTQGMALLGVNVSYSGFRTYLLIPLFALIMCKIWKIPVFKGLDFLTPTLFFIRSVIMAGCALYGCASAIPCAWGIYNPRIECRVFPMDLIDALIALAAGVVSLIYAKKLKYNGNGRVFALALYMTGIVKLFLQLGSTVSWGIRGLNEETVYALIAIVMAVTIFAYNRSLKGKSVENNASTPQTGSAI